MKEQDILQTIVAHKRIEIKQQEEVVSMTQLENLLEDLAPCVSMKQRLAASPTGIIAEFKRRSPSKDWINREADAALIPPAYEQAGASALSILTDERFFGGTLKDIRTARPHTSLPILRKDFTVSRYQLCQAKVTGSDAVLLIASVLSEEECRTLARQAHELQLEVLLELHDEAELGHVNEFVDMVGVNNRHLGTFRTDVETSFRLADRLPKDFLLVSESGISQPETVRQLREAGFRGFLMGEAFMKTADPAATLSGFIKALQP